MKGIWGGMMSAVHASHSLTVEFPPATVFAHIELSKSGGKITHSWISHYSRQVEGEESLVTLSGDPTMFVDSNVTRVTFNVWAAEGLAWANAFVTFWP